MLLRLKIRLSSSDVVQNDQRAARNKMVTARMPEDPSKIVETVNNFKKTFKAIYTCMRTPVWPTETNCNIS
eukprot:854039-Heterocapsa_arctica.AAC.1